MATAGCFGQLLFAIGAGSWDLRGQRFHPNRSGRTAGSCSPAVPTWGRPCFIWGLVIVLILLSIGLGRSRLTPLKTRDWLFLGLGLSQAGIWVWLLVTGWLFALGLRVRLDGGAATLAVQSDVD